MNNLLRLQQSVLLCFLLRKETSTFLFADPFLTSSFWGPFFGLVAMGCGSRDVSTLVIGLSGFRVIVQLWLWETAWPDLLLYSWKVYRLKSVLSHKARCFSLNQIRHGYRNYDVETLFLEERNTCSRRSTIKRSSASGKENKVADKK